MTTYSVTQKIKATKQPCGGYLPPRDFQVTQCNDKNTLYELNSENYSPPLVGIAVDYLTRHLLNKNARAAFKISLTGVRIYLACFASAKSKLEKKALTSKVTTILEAFGHVRTPSDLNEETIGNALFLCNFDQVYRAGKYSPFKGEKVNKKTIFNVQTMVQRSLTFFKKYGPVLKDGFTFCDPNDKTKNGYSNVVVRGDGDFLTSDTLWDFKVSKNEPTIRHTLQLLMYFIMGKQSQMSDYKNISSVGIYNPRLNIVYKFNVSRLGQKIINEIRKQVIEYDD